MNAWTTAMIVTQTLCVQTPMEVLHALVMMDTVEMEQLARVRDLNISHGYNISMKFIKVQIAIKYFGITIAHSFTSDFILSPAKEKS